MHRTAPPTDPGFRLRLLIPSYNSGPLLAETVAAASRFHPDILVVLDGGADEPGTAVAQAARGASVQVTRLPANGGKGAAVLAGLRASFEAGFTHVLTMDSDMQHPADAIPAYVAEAQAAPGSLVAGSPIFGPDAPWIRVHARAANNWMVRALTQGRFTADSLFGMRVYPAAQTLAFFGSFGMGRGFDFETAAAVGLSWAGLAVKEIPTRVIYSRPGKTGLSHYRYAADNWLLARCHLALLRWRASAIRPTVPAPSP